MLGTKILDERKSKFNGDLKVIKSWGMGTYIQAGGLTQSGGIVEDIWKSTLNKIRNTKREIRNVLILGFGGGTVAKLARKIWPEVKITGIDIDSTMVELGKKYLETDLSQIKIKIGDATNFIGKYDLLIIDLYNGDNFPDKFGEIKFLNKVKKSLSKDGIAVFNRLYYGEKRPATVKFGHKLEKIFSKVEWIYPEANIMFICS